MKGNFDNTILLTKFILRRERIISAIWIICLAFAVIGLVPGMQAAIDSDSLDTMIPMLEMPAMISMVGPAPAPEYHASFGAFYTTMMLLFTALTVGLMNIFLVVRYTRTDEEKGRYEVVRSLPTGRLANLNATMITAVLVNIILAVIIVLGLGLFLITNMPLIPKIKREQDDSLEKMMFYTILTLGILITVVYWGTTNV